MVANPERRRVVLRLPFIEGVETMPKPVHRVN